MGYNLIRMHIMSGHLAVNVRDYHRGWKCCLDVLHSPPSEINSADSHGVPMCGRAPWYWHLSTIVRAALEASPPRVAFMTAQRRDVNHHLSPRHLSPTSNSGATWNNPQQCFRYSRTQRRPTQWREKDSWFKITRPHHPPINALKQLLWACGDRLQYHKISACFNELCGVISTPCGVNPIK